MLKVTREGVENILELLEQSPQRITSALMNSQKDVYFKPGQKAWSAHEILMHLRSCADVWGNTVEEMLVKNNPTLAEIHPHVQLKKGNYNEQEFVTSLRVFIEQRAKLLQNLKNIHFEDWSRGAMIGGRNHTVFSQARRTPALHQTQCGASVAKHESEHCEQIESLLK